MRVLNHKYDPELGPGGYKCPCCGPKPGKGKRKYRKAARRLLNRILQKIEIMEAT